MKLPEDVQSTIRQFAAKFPIPPTDDGKREWTHRVAEQLAFSYGDVFHFMHKSAGGGRPHSADVIAAQHVTLGFIGWDLINGATGQLETNGEHIVLTGQQPEPVMGVNYLGTPGPGPGPTPVPDSLAAVLAAIAAGDSQILQAIQRLSDALPALVPVLTAALRAQLAATTFEGEARIFGQRVRFTLTPKVQG